MNKSFWLVGIILAFGNSTVQAADQPTAKPQQPAAEKSLDSWTTCTRRGRCSPGSAAPEIWDGGGGRDGSWGEELRSAAFDGKRRAAGERRA